MHVWFNSSPIESPFRKFSIPNTISHGPQLHLSFSPHAKRKRKICRNCCVKIDVFSKEEKYSGNFIAFTVRNCSHVLGWMLTGSWSRSPKMLRILKSVSTKIWSITKWKWKSCWNGRESWWWEEQLWTTPRESAPLHIHHKESIIDLPKTSQNQPKSKSRPFSGKWKCRVGNNRVW